MKQNNEKNRKKIVVKFGGSSLADHERILRAVTAVAEEAKKGTQIAVIVSVVSKKKAPGVINRQASVAADTGEQVAVGTIHIRIGLGMSTR